MEILVFGGTRFMGCHLVQKLLEAGHQVTVANRGVTGDSFGTKVKRITVDRLDEPAVKQAFKGLAFDVVYDMLAYCSMDVRTLLGVVTCKRYIEVSSVSVYENIKTGMREEDYNPAKHPLQWCRREDFTYDETKRQAEAAIVQEYPQVPSVMVRFPYVIGPDDYTKRLYFYVEKIMNEQEFWVDNKEEAIAFISSQEAGNFLAWLADKTFTGPVNASSEGTVTAGETIEYIQQKTNKKAKLTKGKEAAPYNGAPAFSLNTAKANSWGYAFSSLDSWFYNLLDIYIAQVKQ